MKRPLAVILGAAVFIVLLFFIFRSPRQPIDSPSASDADAPAMASAPPVQPPSARDGQSTSASTSAATSPAGDLPASRHAAESTSQQKSQPASKPTLEGTIYDQEAVVAEIAAGGRRTTVHADGVQAFDRVYVQPREKVRVTVSYTKSGSPGDKVVIQVEDGGWLDDHKIARVVDLDEKKSLSFDYLVSQFPGIHRIRLVKGPDQKVLDLWAGEPLPLASEVASK